MTEPPEPDPLSLWLINNLDVIPYFHVDSPDVESQIQQHRDATLGSLTHFFNFKLLPAAPVRPIFPPPNPNHQTSTFAIHTHFFIQLEIFRCQQEKHEQAKKSLDGLLAALMAPGNSGFIVNIDFDRLFQHYLSDPPTVYALKLKDDMTVADISQNDMLLLTDEQNSQILTQVLFSMYNQYDRKTFFLPPHPMQARFDQFLFHPHFIFHEEVNALLKTPDFGRQCISLMEHMIGKFSLNDSVHLSMFSIIFFRAVFDFAYERRPAMFLLGQESQIRKYSNRYRVQDTGAAIKFVPDHQPKDRLCDIIQRDNSLKEAGRELTAAAFYNSPLDVLYCVHLALTHIRKFVAKIDPEMVQSFDTVFGLFLIVLLGCDLPNPEALFDLVERYAPMNGLSGPLEYARSTISASSMQCRAIVENVKKV